MIQQYREGAIPGHTGDRAIKDIALAAAEAATTSYDKFEFSRALDSVWSIVAAVDKFIVERAPWKMAKDPSPTAQEKLDDTLYTAAEALRLICVLAHPVLPHSTEAIWRQLGFTSSLDEVRAESLTWGLLQAGQKIGIIAPVFPRLDLKTTVEKMQELEQLDKNRHATIMGHAAAIAQEAPLAPIADTISIDDFSKIDLRVGEIRFAEPVKGADKLLHLKVDIGEPEPRTIVAGIALAYKPEQLIGRKVVIVANLEPRKLRGLTSQGMIVAASLGGGLPVLAGFLEDVAPGARLK